MMGMYILIDKKPVLTTDVNEWSTHRASERSLIISDFNVYGDVISVSTVFLGLDHNHGGGIPILFETMVFGGEYDQYQYRYHTYDEAMIGHQSTCDMVDKVSRDRDIKLNDLGI